MSGARLGPLANSTRRLCAALLASLGLFLAAGAFAQDGFARLQGHGGPVKGVAISADGEYALTASFDYTVGLWPLGGGATRWLEGHRAAANAVTFLPDGRRALSAGDDFALILWDLETGKVLRRFDGHRGKVIRVTVNAGGTHALTSGWDGWAGLWDLSGQTQVRWFRGHRGNVNDALFSRDARSVFTASYDGTIREWDAKTGAIRRTLVKHGFGINRMVLNEAEGWLAYGAVDGAVRAITLEGEELADLSADRRPVLALAGNRDGSRLAVGDGEGYVMIIDTRAWRIERDFHAAVRGPIWALAWTPDGTRVLSGGLDDAAALWPIGAAEAEVAGVLARGERSFLADPDSMPNGERQFARKCSICHTLGPDGARRAGPSLWRLFGRRAGTLADYSYSPALTGIDIVWEAETIDRLFAEGPDHFTPGSKMPMQRIDGVDDRRDLIDFLANNTGPRSSVTRNTACRVTWSTSENAWTETPIISISRHWAAS